MRARHPSIVERDRVPDHETDELPKHPRPRPGDHEAVVDVVARLALVERPGAGKVVSRTRRVARRGAVLGPRELGDQVHGRREVGRDALRRRPDREHVHVQVVAPVPEEEAVTEEVGLVLAHPEPVEYIGVTRAELVRNELPSASVVVILNREPGVQVLHALNPLPRHLVHRSRCQVDRPGNLPALRGEVRINRRVVFVGRADGLRQFLFCVCVPPSAASFDDSKVQLPS